MHQQIGILDAYARKINKGLDTSPIQVGSGELGIGRRAMVRINLGEELLIEVFCENNIRGRPRNPKRGFSEEEIYTLEGVSVIEVLSRYTVFDGKKHYHTQGRVVLFNEFLETYVTDQVIRMKLENLMVDLQKAAHLNEGFIEQINSAWINRDPGMTSIGPLGQC